ncbi:hypothetical protein N8A88_26705 [Pseudomonas shahriarae]|uniref:hypothetical protein n=1 Tax=Pseudomonas TaxID=286 RepID=UPI000E0E5E13|nr:hypothetical protein [Pseudomonas shahriarae]MCU0214172.1 hypothetical protein [Pseudomonas shahriarae]
MKKLFKDFETAINGTADLNQALALASAYGNLLWFADVGIHDAPLVEANLIERCLSMAGSTFGATPNQRGGVLHVVTEPYMTGGHTRLMEKLASMHPERTDLLISRQAAPDAKAQVCRFFDKTSVVIATCPVDALTQIVCLLLSYEKAVLHIHPDDILVVVACGVAKRISGLEVYFVNHADHVFSYGSSIADYYFELSGHGCRFDLTKHIQGRKSFLGIPVNIPHGVMANNFKPAMQAPLLFISAGSDIKYKPRKGFSIFKLVARILDDYPASTFLVIGSDVKKAFWWWPLKLRYRSRLSIRAHLDFQEYSELVSKADFYVDSHPLPGGTAFAEQFVKGQRCVGLLSPVQGYSPADRLKRTDIDAVMGSIADYRYDEEVLCAIEKVNAFDSVKERYLKCLYDGQVYANPLVSSGDGLGDTAFFEEPKGSLKVDISLDTFLLLSRLQGGLAIRLFVAMSIGKKIKLLAKMILARKFR